MSDPLVSAILPTIGRPDFMDRAISSIQNQNYEPIEVIIVETPENGVTYGPPDTDLESYYIETEEGITAAAARNIGIQQADGRYIAFLDDDDEWFPEKTSRQLQRLQYTPESIRATFCKNKKINPDGSVKTVNSPKEWDDWVVPLIWGSLIGTFSCLMVESNASENIGHLDPEFHLMEDQDYCLRLAQRYDFSLIDEALVHKHVDGHQQLSGDYKLRKQSISRFQEKHENVVKSYSLTKKQNAFFHYSLGNSAINEGNYWLANSHYLRAIFYLPSRIQFYKYFVATLGGRYSYDIARRIAHSDTNMI